MFKKILLTIISIFVFATATFAEGMTLTGGVSIDKVPKELYGTWRVTAQLVSTTSESTFKNSSVDLWNLSRSSNVITLENPFSGAKASIIVDRVDGKLIKFKKIGNYDSKKLTDVVQLTLAGDRFSGTNYLLLQTLSDVDKTVIKNEVAKYKINGEKISGSSISK